MKKIRNALFFLMAVCYLLLMLNLFFRFDMLLGANRVISRSWNLVPLHTIRSYWSGEIRVSQTLAMYNIFGNIAVFVPYGLYVGALRKERHFAGSLLVVVLTSVCIELIQLLFALGACDIDDVILNTAGGIAGLLGYYLLRGLLRGDDRAKTAVTILSLVVGLPVVAIGILTFLYNR